MAMLVTHSRTWEVLAAMARTPTVNAVSEFSGLVHSTRKQ